MNVVDKYMLHSQIISTFRWLAYSEVNNTFILWAAEYLEIGSKPCGYDNV